MKLSIRDKVGKFLEDHYGIALYLVGAVCILVVLIVAFICNS